MLSLKIGIYFMIAIISYIIAKKLGSRGWISIDVEFLGLSCLFWPITMILFLLLAFTIAPGLILISLGKLFGKLIDKFMEKVK